MPERKLADLMTWNIIQLSSKASVAQAAERMELAQVSSILLIDEAQAVGIVTERDIVRALEQALGEQVPVSAIMSSPVLSAEQTMPCYEAYHLLRSRQIRHLLVVDEQQQPLGIISESDFRYHLGIEFFARFRDLRSLVQQAPAQLDAQVTVREAVSLMRQQALSSVLVCEQQQPVGIITERDIVRLFRQSRSLLEQPLREVMQAPLVAVDISTSIPKAVEFMRAQHIRHLAVVDGKDRKFAGLITEHNLVEHLDLDHLHDSIAATKRTHLRLLENEVKFRVVFEQSSELLVLLDQQGYVLSANRAALEYIALSDAKLILGQYFPDTPWWVGCLEQRERLVSLLLQMQSNKALLEFDADLHCISQRLINLRCSLQYIHSPQTEMILFQGRDITLQRQAQQQLEHEHALLRALLNNIPDIAFYKDCSMQFQGVNQACCELLGLNESQIIGQPDYLIIPQNCMDTVRKFDLQVLQDKRACRYELSVKHPSGQLMQLEMIKTIYMANGEILGIIGIGRDITERKQAEQELRQSEERYRQLFDQSRASMLLIDPGSGAIVDANLAACQYYGYNSDAIKQLNINQIRVQDKTIRDVELAYQQQAQSFFKHRLANGEVREVEMYSGPVRLNGRELLYSIVHDVTVRKQVEQELYKLSWALEQSPVSVVITDINGNIEYTNRKFSQLTGYSRDEVRGCNPRILKSGQTPPERYTQLWLTVLAGRVWQGELLNRKKDGQLYWELAKILPINDPDGEITHFLAIKEDISERKRIEERLRLSASVFANTRDGILITGPDGTILDINGAFTALTGYAREEVLGHNARLLQSGHHDQAFYINLWTSLLRTGHWRGEIWNRRKNGEVYAELMSISAVHDQEGQLTHYVGVFSDITAIKRSEQRLEQLAHYDALTQLPNRVLLQDRLQQAMARTNRQKRLLAIGYLDLDGFKPINDTYGHKMGDQMLIEVANRLRNCTRAGDTVARLGGDEFVLLLTDLGSQNELESVLQRCLRQLKAPFMIAAQEMCVSASIGVTIYPFDNADADTLLRHADQAMYSAKQAGRSCYRFFDDGLWLDPVKQTYLDSLQQALEKDELVLYYQPILNLHTGQICAVEALVRWQHPQLGLLSPGQFLEGIENNRLGITLGEWLLERGLQQLAQWHEQGLALGLSLNITLAHLLLPDFAFQLENYLRRFPELKRNTLELEVAETVVLKEIGLISRVMEACERFGVEFALDDFGTGYTSLTNLRRLPARTLKIDSSFVQALGDDHDVQAVVEGIVGLAKAFKRKTVAEGVESIEQGLALLDLGCDLAQGYAIARPMPAEELSSWLEQYHVPKEWQLQIAQRTIASSSIAPQSV